MVRPWITQKVGEALALRPPASPPALSRMLRAAPSQVWGGTASGMGSWQCLYWKAAQRACGMERPLSSTAKLNLSSRTAYRRQAGALPHISFHFPPQISTKVGHVMRQKLSLAKKEN